jgi:hypothetical protein
MAIYPNINKLTEEQIKQAVEQSMRGVPIDSVQTSAGLKFAIKTWSEEIVKQMRGELMLKLEPPRDGSGLAQSITATPVQQENTIFLSGIIGAPYWQFIEYGVSGTELDRGLPNRNTGRVSRYDDKQPPSDVIRKWIPQTGWRKPEGTKDKNGNPIKYTYESWAFVIARNIKKRGLKPKPFTYVAMSNDNKQRLIDALAEITKTQFKIVITHPQTFRQ